MSEFTEKEIQSMRRKLARCWRQKVSQIYDHEAIHYLRKEREAKRVLAKG